MKKSIILKSLGLNKLSSTSNLLKKTMQVTAFTFSCLVALPSFFQTADASEEPLCGNADVDCYDDGEIFAWGSGSNRHWSDDIDWDWVIYPTGDYPPGCDEYGCDGGSSGGGNNPPPPPPPNYDPVVCNSLLNGPSNPNYVSGNPNAPNWCSTDPGPAINQDYSGFVSSEIYNILPRQQGCWQGYCGPAQYEFPFMTESSALTAISNFANAYYTSNDYVVSRNLVWSLLSLTCVAPYWGGYQPATPEQTQTFNDCIHSQFDFMMSMAPETGYNSQWRLGLSYNIPWGGSISLNVGNNTQFRNWTSKLITKVSKASRCHTWYQALDAANCPTP